MGSALTPNQQLTTTVVGTTTIAEPILLLLVNGVGYANGYRVDYTGAYQNFFPAKDGNNILLCCQSVAASADLPTVTVNNIEVLVIGY